MGFVRVCSDGELGDGEMAAFSVDGWEVIVLRDRLGALHALDGICPHEEFPLVYGSFDRGVLTCVGHGWSFDPTTGRGINPPNCRLAKYAVKVEGDEIYVDRDSEPDVPVV
jgi:toluene monooxygenase system ferredoxin subunit